MIEFGVQGQVPPMYVGVMTLIIYGSLVTRPGWMMSDTYNRQVLILCTRPMVSHPYKSFCFSKFSNFLNRYQACLYLFECISHGDSKYRHQISRMFITCRLLTHAAWKVWNGTNSTQHFFHYITFVVVNRLPWGYDPFSCFLRVARCWPICMGYAIQHTGCNQNYSLTVSFRAN